MKLKRKKFLLLFIPMLLGGILLFSIIMILIGGNEINDMRNEIKTHEHELLLLEEETLNANFYGAMRDMVLIRDEIKELDMTDKEDQAEIAKLWINIMNSSNTYDEMTFYDKQGNELVRVDYTKEKGAARMPDSELSNQASKSFYLGIANQDQNGVYISDLDINLGEAYITGKNNPLIRFGKKIYNDKNEVMGALMIGYKIEQSAVDFEALSKSSYGDTYIINEEGYYITVGDDLDRLWTYEDLDLYSGTLSFVKDHNFEFEEMQGKTEGQIYTHNGLTTYKDFEYTFPEKGADIFEGLDFREQSWKMISLVPVDGEYGRYVEIDKVKTAFTIMKENIFGYIIIIFVATLVSVLLVSTKSSTKEIQYLSDHDQLTKALNRTAGTRILEELMKKHTEQNIDVSIWFIDVNGVQEVNNVLGEIKGDELITKTCDIIRAEIPNNSDIIRYSGDEFIVYFEGLSTEKARIVWTKIEAAFKKFNEDDSVAYTISVSKGELDFRDSESKVIQNIIDTTRDKMQKHKESLKKAEK